MIEIFLQPGDLYFGGQETRIRTLLGSCVAVTLWHPREKIGGMCHFMLPSRVEAIGEPLSGRYGDEALQMLMAEIVRSGTRPAEYEVKVFGAGTMFTQPARGGTCVGAAPVCGFLESFRARLTFRDASPAADAPRCGSVPCKNAVAVRSLLAHYGLRISAEDLGGNRHRSLIFDVSSGDVWLRQQAGDNPPCVSKTGGAA